MCGRACHNCACAFSRSVKNQLFQNAMIYTSLDAEFEVDQTLLKLLVALFELLVVDVFRNQGIKCANKRTISFENA